MRVELRHARLVAAIASAGSISAAAIQLSLPQPALSSQLRRLEREFGGELFIRSHSGVVPTPLGERLIPMLVDLARRGDALLAEVAAQNTNTLRVGNVEWTPPALRDAIAACLPSVEVQTETVDPADAMSAVGEGLLNLALVPSPPNRQSIDVKKLPLSTAVVVREPMWLALPTDHPLAGQEPVGAAQLRSLAWVRYARGHWFHDHEKAAFADLLDQQPESVHRVRGHHEAMSWVREAGVAALTVPTGATKDVSLVPILDAHTCELLLVWRTGSISRSTVGTLLESVRSYYCAYARTIPRYWSWMVAHPEGFREVQPFLTDPPQDLPGPG
ncbi:LysR family transcriptional regulator [Streptomyces sp. DH10]|uniref:LysR family transcriptional regulator n=1 Tax=Streptomyces sp. DH10 TaxID=3040121 RepID=UPI0024432B8D|nr:LysR family transcriptional regulator [Streptomyces sp. DH10]MDG9708969.1 LysR family transcriptional regulator [Streptomyces sp. DH10]